VVFVSLVLLAGCDAPTRPEHATRLDHLGLAATVQPNGDVAMNAAIRYPSDDGGSLRLGAPTLGTISDVAINRSPRTASGENVDLDLEGSSVIADWVLHNAVERYPDATIVTIPVWTPSRGEDGNDKRIPVWVQLHLPSAPISNIRWHGARVLQPVSMDGQTINVQGDVAPDSASEISFLMSADAVPAAPVLAGASRVTSYEDRQAPLDTADRRIASDIRDDQQREDLIANAYWAIVALEIAIPFLITLLALIRGASARRTADEGVPKELTDLPSDLAPAVVSLLRADGQDIGKDAIAATILQLVNSHALQVDGITSERYAMKVTGSGTTPAEHALLAAIGGRAGPDGTITGPPLGLSTDGTWWKTLRREVVSIARSERLLRRRFRSGLFVTAVVALAITTLPLYARSPETVIGGIVVATILASLPFVGGYVLTAGGHRERAKWEAYGRHLRGGDMGDVGVPGIVVWEQALVYGAALGVATKAIGDLT
jgi:hypothetical protein